MQDVRRTDQGDKKGRWQRCSIQSYVGQVLKEMKNDVRKWVVFIHVTPTVVVKTDANKYYMIFITIWM